MEKLLEVFSLKPKAWREIRNILLHLKQHGKTGDDLITHITAEETRTREEVEALNIQLKGTMQECSICTYPMRILPVNVSPATMTGDKSKSVWLCSNPDCMNTIYNRKDVKTIIEDLTRR